jgi:hypothetical protein
MAEEEKEPQEDERESFLEDLATRVDAKFWAKVAEIDRELPDDEAEEDTSKEKDDGKAADDDKAQDDDGESERKPPVARQLREAGAREPYWARARRRLYGH